MAVIAPSDPSSCAAERRDEMISYASANPMQDDQA